MSSKTELEDPYRILFPHLLKKTLFLVLFFINLSHGFSQNGEGFHFYFETDTIVVDQGQTFLNFLVLKNDGDSEISVDNLRPAEQYPGLLLSPKKNLVLAAGESKRFPIKFLANTEFMKMKWQKIGFRVSFSSEGIKKELTTAFSIYRNEEKQIALYPFSRENYLTPEQAETTVSLFVENRGYSTRSIQLIFQAVPDGLEIRPRELTLPLESQEKRLVEFTVLPRHQKQSYPNFNIHVKAIDLMDDENVGNTYLRLVVLSHNRQVIQGPGAEVGKNFAEVAYNEQSNGFNFLQLKGNTQFAVSENIQGRLNLATDYYFTEDKYNLYDTWLEVERKNTLLRLGNLYTNDYDYSVSGRGGLFNTALGGNRTLEVFALDNNYNLYGTYFPETEGSKIAGTKFSFGSAGALRGKISYVFDHNPRLETDSQVAHATTTFTVGSGHNFRAEGGLSHEKGRINGDANTGMMAAINYDAKMGNWDLQSLNTLGSKTYAGLNRGSINLHQNIGYSLSAHTRIFLQYQNSQVRPSYLSVQQTGPFDGQQYFPRYFYSTQSGKLGAQLSTGNWSISLLPQVEKQKNTSNYFREELLSYRFRMAVGTVFGGHGLDASAEYSYSIPEDIQSFHSLKSTLSYRYRGLSLNGSVEINPNNVMDLNYYSSGTENFLNYNVHTAYIFQLLGNSLTGTFAAGLNYSELYNNTNKSVHGNVEYKISPSWAATGYGNYSKYNSTLAYGFSGSNYQFKVGVKKYFIRNTAPGHYKLSIQLFHDKNFNGVLDTGETLLTNEPVHLDAFVAITDEKGKVNFQNIPPGNYVLKINETAGLRMSMDPNITVDRNKTLKIGLVKKTRVTGSLAEIKQPYDQLETYVRGVVVYAKDLENNITSTVVDQNGEFEFFLANGTYQIFIENNKYEYLKPSQTITVDNGEFVPSLLFEYKKKDTEIKVKKF